MDVGKITDRQAKKYLTDNDFGVADITVCASQEAINQYSSQNRTDYDTSAYMVEAGIFSSKSLSGATKVDGKNYTFEMIMRETKTIDKVIYNNRSVDFSLNNDKLTLKGINLVENAYGEIFVEGQAILRFEL